MKDIISSVATAQGLSGYRPVQAQPGTGVPVPAGAGQPAADSGRVSPQQAASQARADRQAASQEVEDVRRAVEDINSHFQSVGRDLKFQVDKESGRTIITVLDSETKEVVRQIPPEEVLNLAERLHLGASVDSTGLAEKV
ncbi:MAG TPA: flagellar protein FlaG [Chromatiales bacterium]|nr:flagellar protein FlaG [Chromatiales bacterium]